MSIAPSPGPPPLSEDLALRWAARCFGAFLQVTALYPSRECHLPTGG